MIRGGMMKMYQTNNEQMYASSSQLESIADNMENENIAAILIGVGFSSYVTGGLTWIGGGSENNDLVSNIGICIMGSGIVELLIACGLGEGDGNVPDEQ